MYDGDDARTIDPPARDGRVSAAPELPPPHRLLEVAIRDYPLWFPDERDQRVESAAFPDMVSIYRGLTSGYIPPSQGAFGDEVAGRVRGLPRSAVFARACRAYPSFVRQHHAVLALRGQFPVVSWDRWLDQLQGVDVLVVDERGLAAGIDLSTDTATARAWQGVKGGRHAAAPIPVLDAHVNPGEYRVGAFWLHDPEQLVARVRAVLEQTIVRALAELERDVDEVYRRTERRPKCSRQDFEAGVRGAVAYIKRRWLDRVSG
jgi:hypothetical protein